MAEEVWPASSGLRRAGEEGKEGGTNEREARQVGFSILYFFLPRKYHNYRGL